VSVQVESSIGSPAEHRALWPAYAAESLSSVGTTLLTVGIFFFTEHYFAWGLKQNFLLSTGQGAFYAVGALLAQPIAARFGRRRGLVGIYLLMAGMALCALATRGSGIVVVALLLYALVSATNWPALESLVASGFDAHEMSRRIGTYNLVWSGTNVVALAISGTIIERWPAGMFILPAGAHVMSAMLMWLRKDVEPPIAAAAETAPPARPEPELLSKRTLALWLSRIALPSTYVVVYGMMAMMPSLPVMQPLSTALRTVAGSAWMASRWVTFLILGATIWWHTRPRLLLAAAAIMLIAFFGVTVRPSALSALGSLPYAADLASMICWQMVLGIVMGIIYAASLYFGMVLSEGSTEHGGYHEALIGLGSVIGPGSGAVAQWLWPGHPNAGLTAVAAVIAISVAAAAIAAKVVKSSP
jgi:MFS family permease